MAVAQNDVIQASWESVHSDPNTRMVQHFYFQAFDVVDGDEQNCAQDIQTQLLAIWANVQPHLSNRYVLETIRVTNQTQKVLMLDSDGGGFTGTGGAGQATSAQVAALAIARSNKLGHQGRKYIGPPLEDDVDNGNLSAPFLAAMEAFASAWDAPFNGAITNNAWIVGTVKFAQGGAVQAFTEFTNGLSSAEPVTRTQRSRTPGKGLS